MEIRVKEYRKRKGIPAARLAAAIGVTAQTYYKKEQGILRFNLQDAKAIAERCGDTIEAVFFGAELPKTENESLERGVKRR